ncbi:MAG: helix-turn-helix transcriptional regulator [Bacteroidia bacterium]|nr:helix-turn-helix transcriptional regulator [Bacteroidia bacterium]
MRKIESNLLKKDETIQLSKKGSNQLISFEDHLDELYGIRGTQTREAFEEEFETFKIGVLIQELRKEHGLTQDQLAKKCGTTKTYISRIENNASDIRLSTLMRIVREGFGKHLKFTVEL